MNEQWLAYMIAIGPLAQNDPVYVNEKDQTQETKIGAKRCEETRD